MKKVVRNIFSNAFMSVNEVKNEIFSKTSTFVTFGRNATKHGAIIIPVDKEGNVILTKEYRIGADVEVIGVPKGAADQVGETAHSIATRELREELGFTFDRIEETSLNVYPLPAFADFSGKVVVAFGVQKTSEQTLEDGESIEMFCAVDRDTLTEMLKSGKIDDAESVAALQHYLLFY